jgi:hypothetical protein
MEAKLKKKLKRNTLTSGSTECPLSLQGDTLDRAMHRGSSLGNSSLHYESLACTN